MRSGNKRFGLSTGLRMKGIPFNKFFNVNATKDVYFFSFFPRTLRMWNKLLKDIVESDCLETFETKISECFTE